VPLPRPVSGIRSPT